MDGVDPAPGVRVQDPSAKARDPHHPSTDLGKFVGYDEVGELVAAILGADALLQFSDGQRAVAEPDRRLTVVPFGFYRVAPRVPTGQWTTSIRAPCPRAFAC